MGLACVTYGEKMLSVINDIENVFLTKYSGDQNNAGRMGVACVTYGEKSIHDFCFGNLKERNNFEDLSMVVMIIFIWIYNK
jgi:hypothetical protein